MGADWAFTHGIVSNFIDSAARELHVLVVDPTDVAPLDELSFRSGMRVRPRVVTESELLRATRYLYFDERLDAGRPSAPPPQDLSDQGPAFTYGIQEELGKLHRSQDRKPSSPAPVRSSSAPSVAPPRPSVVDPILFALQRLAVNQEAAAMELQALFELCAEKRVFTRPEYMNRLGTQRD